jgi:signal transduction histidine kinase
LAVVDPAKEVLARKMWEHASATGFEKAPIKRLLRGGRGRLQADVGEEEMAAAAGDEHHLALLRQLDLRSCIEVPLVARGRALGAVTFGMIGRGRRYTREDLATAEEFGHRVAMAVYNAKVFEESQAMQDALLRANEAKDEFLSMMSHELRTPITTIFGGMQVLRSRGDRMEQSSREELLADIEWETDRLYRLVNDMLVLSRVELGEAAQTEPVLLQEVVMPVCDAFARRRPARPLEIHIDPAIGPVEAVPTYVEQIVRNLLSNADKYSPPAGVIEMRAERRGDGVEVRVLDRGVGIDPQDADRIFDRFFRANSVKRLPGVGMGLTVCRRLAEAQGGRIEARPRDGGGLEVTLTLATPGAADE